MKKVMAVALAIIIAISMVTIAFAVDVYTCPTCGKKYTTIDEYNACVASHEDAPAASTEEYQCPTCGKIYDNLDDYNACIDSHFSNITYRYDKYIGAPLQDLLGQMVDIFNSTGFLEIVVDFVKEAWTMLSGFIGNVAA